MENIVTYLKDWFEKYQPPGTLIEKVLWVIWVIWVVQILVSVLRVINFRFCLGREIKSWDGGKGLQRSAVVIVPIKGVSPSHTSDFFQSLLEQDYWNYRVIVAVETSDDPAAEWLFDQFGISLSNPVWAPEEDGDGIQSLQLVVAGKCRGRGQKVHNQLAAFDEMTSDDEIVVFVDADIVCPENWLAKLTSPINSGKNDPTTTYRWLVPKRMRLASQFASVINASVTTQGGNARENMPWGGSMAISRATFDDIDVPALFDGSLNDDLRLGKAAKKAGYKVGYVRNLVRPTEVDFSWRAFFEFARRQYLQVKIFAPILYLSANLIFLIYFLGFASIVTAIAVGYLWAWVPLVLATLLDQVRATTRESIYRLLFGADRDVYKRIARTSWLEHFLTPVYMLMHGLVILTTWFMNKVEWGGVKYQVEGVNKTRVLKRKPVEPVLNLNSVGELALPAGGAFAGLAAVAASVLERKESREAAKLVENVGEEIKDETVTIDETGPIHVSEPEEVDLEEHVSMDEGFEEELEEEVEEFDFEKERISLLSELIPGACDFVVVDGQFSHTIPSFETSLKIDTSLDENIEEDDFIERVPVVPGYSERGGDRPPPAPVSAIPNVASAAPVVGFGAPLPPKTRFIPPGTSRAYRNTRRPRRNSSPSRRTFYRSGLGYPAESSNGSYYKRPIKDLRPARFSLS